MLSTFFKTVIHNQIHAIVHLPTLQMAIEKTIREMSEEIDQLSIQCFENSDYRMDHYYHYLIHLQLIYNALFNSNNYLKKKDSSIDFFYKKGSFLYSCLQEDLQAYTFKEFFRHTQEEIFTYQKYLISIQQNSLKLFAHLYARHVQDFKFGQIIRQINEDPTGKFPQEMTHFCVEILKNGRETLYEDYLSRLMLSEQNIFLDEMSHAFQITQTILSGINKETGPRVAKIASNALK